MSSTGSRTPTGSARWSQATDRPLTDAVGRQRADRPTQRGGPVLDTSLVGVMPCCVAGRRNPGPLTQSGELVVLPVLVAVAIGSPQLPDFSSAAAGSVRPRWVGMPARSSSADHDDDWYETGDLAVPAERGGISLTGRVTDRIGGAFMIPVNDRRTGAAHPAGDRRRGTGRISRRARRRTGLRRDHRLRDTTAHGGGSACLSILSGSRGRAASSVVARRGRNPRTRRSPLFRPRFGKPLVADTAEIEPLLRASATVEIDTRKPLTDVVDQLAALAGQPPSPTDRRRV
jgi:hypothetical protein